MARERKQWRLIIQLRGHVMDFILNDLFWSVLIVFVTLQICWIVWCRYLIAHPMIPMFPTLSPNSVDETLLWHHPYYNQPQSTYHQFAEGYPHFPSILFQKHTKETKDTIQTQPGYRINRTLCDHTILGEITIDSRGNICDLNSILNTGCCPLDSIKRPTLGLAHCDGEYGVDRVPWELFEDHKCECYREHSHCIAGCIHNFVGTAWDDTKQDIYRWETCKYICSTSSKSTFRGQLFKDPEYRYCFGNQFFPSTEYGIFALLA